MSDALTCMPEALGGQKRALEALKMELQMVVGWVKQVLCKSNKCSKPLSHSSRPKLS